MRVLIFEWINGGGLWCDGQTPVDGCSFQRQGMAMQLAVASDLSKLGHQVEIFADRRIPLNPDFGFETTPVDSCEKLPQQLNLSATSANAVILIAPESDGCLLKVHEWLAEFSDRIICPKQAFIKLTSDKNRLANFLTAQGIRVPAGSLMDDSSQSIDVDFPVVIKPNDGAGSESIQLAQSIDEIVWPPRTGQFRIERFVAGKPVSVSVIASGRQAELLPPTGQRFDTQPIGHYVEPEFPLPHDIAQRATSLAQRCVDALPATQGYFGIDMVIADAGSDSDCVIEVNPRLTCSYVGLRKIVSENMAASMLKCLSE